MASLGAYLRLIGAASTLVRNDALLPRELDGFYSTGVRTAARALRLFASRKDGRPGGTLFPEKRSYHSSEMPMTEAAIDAGFMRDVYVSLGEPLGGRAWAVRVYYKPFINWIWGGCLMMALGGLFAACDRRYRLKVKAPAAAGALQGAPT